MNPVFEHTAEIGRHVQLEQHEQEVLDAARNGSSILSAFGFGARPSTPMQGTVIGFKAGSGKTYGLCDYDAKVKHACVKWDDGSDGIYSIGANGKYDLCYTGWYS